MTSDLHDLLELSLAGEPAARPPIEDLRRARHAVRGRRVRAALVGTGAVAAAAVVATAAWSSGAAGVTTDNPPPQSGGLAAATTYVPPAWSPGASSYEPEELTDAEALARCSTVEYTDSKPADPPADTIAPYSRPIYAGDVVEIAVNSPVPTDMSDLQGGPWWSCVIPGTWTDPTPGGSDVTDASFRADDTEAILLGCSAVAQIDLRDWVVAAAMVDGAGGVAASVVTADQRSYANCEFGGVYREIWFSHRATPAQAHAQPVGGGQLGMNGGGGPSHSRANVLPAGVEALKVRLADGSAIDVPVGVHGTYAVSILVDGGEPVVEAYDGDGELVLACAPGECE